MVKAGNNVDLSLDDIISKTRKTKSSIQKKPYSRPAGGHRPTGIPRRSGGGGGWKDLDDVSNHGITSRSSNDSKIVRISIANLASTVISSDLQELFGDFNLSSVAVNFNEHGESLGTGDVTLAKRDAERLLKNFTGVALDGKMMKFNLIDTNSMAGRVDFGSRVRTSPGRSNRGFSSGGRRPFNKSKPEDFLRDGVHEGESKRGGGGGGRGGQKGGRGGGRDQKPKKTEAELDAELEAYMAKRNA